MDDAPRVHVADYFAYLPEKSAGLLLLGQPVLLDPMKQVGALDVLEDDLYLHCILIDVTDPDDAGVRLIGEDLVDVDLMKLQLQLLGDQVLLLDLLDGYRLASPMLGISLDDTAIGALTKDLGVRDVMLLGLVI